MKVFLTDWASYNNGTQFEFGHWVDLEQFTELDEFWTYVADHFSKADQKSPLDEFGSVREEILLSDFEEFPKVFYDEGGSGLKWLFQLKEMDEGDQAKVCFILEQNGGDFGYAFDHYENVHMHSYTKESDVYEIFEMFYPETVEAETKNNFLTINYDRFKEELFTEFEYEGDNFLVEDSWNH